MWKQKQKYFSWVLHRTCLDNGFLAQADLWQGISVNGICSEPLGVLLVFFSAEHGWQYLRGKTMGVYGVKHLCRRFVGHTGIFRMGHCHLCVGQWCLAQEWGGPCCGMFCVPSGSCSPQDLGIVQQHLSSLSWDLRTDAQPSGHLAERNTVTWTPWLLMFLLHGWLWFQTRQGKVSTAPDEDLIQIHATSCVRASARLACDIFSLVHVPHVPVKNTVAGTTYQLKLSALSDLLEVLCTLAPEASGGSN